MMLSGLSLPEIALLAAGGMLLDCLLGEPRRWHPLVGFGAVAQWLEQRLNRGNGRWTRGAMAWLLAVVPAVALAAWALALLPALIAAIVHVLGLYFCIGLRSLRDHTLPIATALEAGDVGCARALTSRIVSRDTSQAAPSDLAKASVESILENGNDAVFGTLFWFVVAGAPGALLFRLANTLDAMWGYRTVRFRAFGCTAARIDDALNWFPARLTALCYALLGNPRCAWQCWRRQAPAWSSPNAGPVMAAGAGSLGLLLGGPAWYDGVLEHRPPLGAGAAPQAGDIRRALRMVERTTLLWLLLLLAAALFGVQHA